MTYKRSSVSKAKRSDLLNCLKTYYIFPLISLIVTLLLGILTITSVLKGDKDSIQYALFGNEFLFNSSTIVAIVALLSGIITGIRSFSFLHKVPSTNVYLSLPITRIDLFNNRLLVATIYNLIASVIPMAILIGLNYALFKPTKDFPMLCLYFIVFIFIHSMLGFTISSLSSVAVGKRTEAGFFSLVLLLLPKFILTIMTNLQAVFANGTGSMVSFTGYAKPEFSQFSEQLNDKLSFLDPLRLMYEAPVSMLLDGKKFAGYNFKEEVLPLIIIGVIIAIVIAITPIIFNRRLAENADAVGVSKGLTVLTSYIIATLILSLCVNIPPVVSEIMLTIIGLLLSVIAYFIVYAILTRNKKKIGKSLKVLPLVAVGGVVIILATLGVSKIYYSRVPDVQNIKCAYAVASGSDVVFKSITSNSGFDSKVAHDTVIGEITDKEDLKLLTDIHKNITKNLYKGDGTFKVLYVMNDNTVITRTYYKIGKEATKQTYKIYETKAYNDMLKYRLTVDEDKYLRDKETAMNKWLSYGYETEMSEEKILNNRLLSLINTKYNDDARFVTGLIYLADKNGTNSTLLSNKLDEEQIKELKQHLYNDLSKTGGIERNFNDNTPAYYLAFTDIGDYYDLYNNLKNPNQTNEKPSALTIDDFNNDSKLPENIGDFHFKQFVPIYKDMTETIAYLNKMSITIAPIKADEIESAEYFSAKGRFDTEKLSELYATPDYKKVKDDAFYLEVRSKGLNDYTDKFGRLVYENTTTDAAQIAELFNGSRATYQIVEDNGLIVKFIAKNGTRYTAYVPEANVPSFAK